MHFQMDTTEVLNALQSLESGVQTSVLENANDMAEYLEQRAKAGAPWQNQSGRARASIKGSATVAGGHCQIVISGNTDYFPYLELGKEGRFAILWPTIWEQSGHVLRRFADLFQHERV